MKRNVIALLAVSAMVVGGLTSCVGTSTSSSVAPKGEGKVLNIRVWNVEFISRFALGYAAKISKKIDADTYLLDDGVTVKFTVVANDGNGYQTALDAQLLKQDTAAADDKVDMFLMEADYALKYANSDYSLDVKKDVGLTDDDLGQMYDYTKTIATDTRAGKNNALKGVSWQATPGLYAYRTDIADTVLGTHDPVEVQAKLSDWTKFNAAAKTAKDDGYFMLSGYDDSYRVFSNNATQPWVDANKKVVLDPQMKQWVKDTKDYTDKGYNNKTKLWDSAWGADQGPTGKVLGFFYSTWGIDFTLKDNSLATSIKNGGAYAVGNGLYGKYRVCQGPASWYWGGTWLCAAKGTDNITDVKDIMRVLTCNQSVADQITRTTEDYTNNKAAMHAIATDSTFGSDFLGGQNHIALFEKNAAAIKLAAMTAYDQGCNEKFQNAMHDYFAGTVDYATAYANFKTALTATYPVLTSFDDASFAL
jgi:multiple sugar transport system substrate-binding protein